MNFDITLRMLHLQSVICYDRNTTFYSTQYFIMLLPQHLNFVTRSEVQTSVVIQQSVTQLAPIVTHTKEDSISIT